MPMLWLIGANDGSCGGVCGYCENDAPSGPLLDMLPERVLKELLGMALRLLPDMLVLMPLVLIGDNNEAPCTLWPETP